MSHVKYALWEPMALEILDQPRDTTGEAASELMTGWTQF